MRSEQVVELVKRGFGQTVYLENIAEGIALRRDPKKGYFAKSKDDNQRKEWSVAFESPLVAEAYSAGREITKEEYDSY